MRAGMSIGQRSHIWREQLPGFLLALLRPVSLGFRSGVEILFLAPFLGICTILVVAPRTLTEDGVSLRWIFPVLIGIDRQRLCHAASI